MKIDNDMMMAYICEAQDSFIENNTSKEDVFDVLLDGFLKLTNSEYGFIGEVYLDKDNLPYLNTVTITNIAWTDDLYKIFSKRSGIKFTALSTLFGIVLTDKEVVISNNPKTDNRRGGEIKIPKGHPPLKRFLGIPIIFDGEMIGMIGIANSTDEYTTEAVTAMKQIISNCSVLIRGYRRITENENMILGNKARLSAVSHEIMTPMNSILGYAQLVLDDVEGDSFDHVKNIISSCNILLDMVNRILNVNKPSELANVEQIDIEKLLTEMVTASSYSINRLGLNINITVEPDIRVVCDKPGLVMVISNFLSNAIKYNTQNGEINIRVTSSPPEMIFENTGKIISNTSKQSIFEPYTREDKNSHIQGSGIGLSIVKETAIKMKQSTFVETSEKYNIFHFSLDIEKIECSVNSVLYIEDNEFNVNLMKSIFKKKLKDYTLDIAYCGDTGIEKLKHNKFNLLLLDLNLPDTDGFKIMEEMSTLKINIPVIIVTADSTESVKKRLYDANVKSIIKPFDIINLIKLIKEPN